MIKANNDKSSPWNRLDSRGICISKTGGEQGAGKSAYKPGLIGMTYINIRVKREGNGY